MTAPDDNDDIGFGTQSIDPALPPLDPNADKDQIRPPNSTDKPLPPNAPFPGSRPDEDLPDQEFFNPDTRPVPPTQAVPAEPLIDQNTPERNDVSPERIVADDHENSESDREGG